jgi:hypothetical protein
MQLGSEPCVLVADTGKATASEQNATSATRNVVRFMASPLISNRPLERRGAHGLRASGEILAAARAEASR